MSIRMPELVPTKVAWPHILPRVIEREGSKTSKGEQVRQTVDDAIEEERKKLERRRAADETAGRVRLTDVQLLVLDEMVRIAPAPGHAYGLYKSLGVHEDAAPSEQAVRNALDRLEALGLVAKDRDLVASGEGPARTQYRLVSIDDATMVLATERQRRVEFVARLGSFWPTQPEVRFDEGYGHGGLYESLRKPNSNHLPSGPRSG